MYFCTGSFILMNTGSKTLHSKSGLLTTVAWQLGEAGRRVYCLEGGAFVCGAAVQWLRDGLKIIKSAPDIEALAATVSDHGGVEFVPALTGLGAPHWAPDARGTLTGITRGTEQPYRQSYSGCNGSSERRYFASDGERIGQADETFTC